MSKQSEMIKDVADKIVALMDKHGTDWTKPWASKVAEGFPVNVASNKNYQGINVFWLGMTAWDKGYSSNVWGTFKQWAALGGNLKGQKATDVFFWKPLDVDAKGLDGQPLKNEKGEVIKKKIWMLKNYKVFNRDQVAGLEDEAPADADAAPIVVFNNDEVDAWVDHTGANVRHGGASAFYSPATDHVQMPNREDFTGTATSTAEETYYTTLLHELVHWSGAKHRLDRTKGKRFGDSDYAFEELVAETGAAILAVQLGVSPEPRADHAQYLNGWIKGLKDNPKAIFSAFTQATKAAEYLNGLQPGASEEVAA
jgi:antirestriction protein ArdC